MYVDEYLFRFAKENGFYQNLIFSLQENFIVPKYGISTLVKYFYETVFLRKTEILCAINEWGRLGLSHSLIEDFNKKTSNLIDTGFELKIRDEDNQEYTNIVTDIFKDFMSTQTPEILAEFIRICKIEGKLPKIGLVDGSIDRLLRRHKEPIVNLISSTETFCLWSEYRDIHWATVCTRYMLFIDDNYPYYRNMIP